MKLIISTIIIVAGFLGLNQSILGAVDYRRRRLAVSFVLFFLYACLVAATVLFYYYSGHNFYIIYAVLFLVSISILGLFLYRIIASWYRIRKGIFTLFLIYLAIILYATLIMRIGMDLGTPVLTEPFSRVRQALSTGNWMLMSHFVLNLALFLPFGFFIRLMDQDRSNTWGNALLFGVMLSTMIEGLQMILMLGECDIDDIIGNTIGCLVGFFLGQFYLSIGKNWHFHS